MDKIKIIFEKLINTYSFKTARFASTSYALLYTCQNQKQVNYCQKHHCRNHLSRYCYFAKSRLIDLFHNGDISHSHCLNSNKPFQPHCHGQSSKEYLRRIPFKVRAITCKNYLLKIYSQHANFLNAIQNISL